MLVADSPFEAPFLAKPGSPKRVSAVTLLGDLGLRLRARLEGGADVRSRDGGLRARRGHDARARDGGARRERPAARWCCSRPTNGAPLGRRRRGASTAGWSSRCDTPRCSPPCRDDVLPRQTAMPAAAASERGDTVAMNVLLAEDNAINALLRDASPAEARRGNVTHAPDGIAALALAEAALDSGQPFDVRGARHSHAGTRWAGSRASRPVSPNSPVDARPDPDRRAVRRSLRRRAPLRAASWSRRLRRQAGDVRSAGGGRLHHANPSSRRIETSETLPNAASAHSSSRTSFSPAGVLSSLSLSVPSAGDTSACRETLASAKKREAKAR